MHTIITSSTFQEKTNKKYDSNYLDDIIEQLSAAPRMGKKFTAVNNIFMLDIGLTTNKKAEYNLVYYYQGKNQPLYIINIFKKKKKTYSLKLLAH